LKQISVILILILISCIVGIAGCTSQNNNSYDTNSISSYNNSSNPQKEVNNTPATTKNYEASGYCPYVVDGDTIDVDGVGRIRFVGVNTPERGQPGYQEAKDFVSSLCLGKTVGLDIDNAKHYDKYGRVLAVVYSGDTNVNAELLKRGYAEVMYIPPSEFNPYSWANN
jgi:micrococcal nuclease